MCSLVCSDSFSLQEHVELHLDQEAAMNSSGTSILVQRVFEIKLDIEGHLIQPSGSLQHRASTFFSRTENLK